MRLALLATLALILAPSSPASNLTPAEEKELTEFKIRTLDEAVRQMKALNAELAKDGTPYEEPKGGKCFGVFAAAADLVADGQLQAADFPGIALKREKARAALTAIFKEEGLDAEGMQVQFDGEQFFYDDYFRDASGKLKRAPGFVDSRVKYCDKQF